MADCIICQIVEGKIPSKKVYEDDELVAILDVNGANPGHCFVIPKQHFPIMEQVPDNIIAKAFSVANKISISIFDELKAQGTNLFVANGIPAGQKVAHFMINVVPRYEGDIVNMTWKPRQLSEEEMSAVELKIKEHSENIGGFSVSSKPKSLDSKKIESISSEEDEDNYLMKSLTRIP